MTRPSETDREIAERVIAEGEGLEDFIPTEYELALVAAGRAAGVREVEEYITECLDSTDGGTSEFINGYQHACSHILAHIKQEARDDV